MIIYADDNTLALLIISSLTPSKTLTFFINIALSLANPFIDRDMTKNIKLYRVYFLHEISLLYLANFFKYL